MYSVHRPRHLVALEAEVWELWVMLLAAEAAHADEISAVHPSHHRSAANLIHYLELRNHDIRRLQSQLSALGLSSLGRSEPHVLATVEAVLAALAEINDQTPPPHEASIALPEGHDLLNNNADQLLGPAPAQRSTRIMVTLPSEAANDPSLVARLVANGMDVARINCAHDDTEAWARMIQHIRSCTTADGRPCRVAMDLAGPKLRTGPLQPGPRAVRIAPKRDHTGHVVTPALMWLANPDESPRAEHPEKPILTVPVTDPAWLQRRKSGDRIKLRDSRGSQRVWKIVDVFPGHCLASTEQTTYLMTGSQLTCHTDDGDDAVTVGKLPAIQQFHRVHYGDQVILTRSLVPAIPTPAGTTHHIGCSQPEAFEHARPGQRVWLDDGKIGGAIVSVTDDEITLTVTDVRPGGANLKAGKGINMPDTDLHLDALTPKDLKDLEFVARHADIVNLSFVRRPEDVGKLQSQLRGYTADNIGIVLKIENVAAFENLPELLFAAMRSPHVGVMIARGDLAVEVGFDRLAEVQEEIMWACEAAHVPVIWATQVLDTLARTGQPSRAEVTDAAMSERAECVMLNKGTYIVEAISALDSILMRMQDHQDKKRSLLRRLHSWDRTSQPV